ncbi:hypothetical protein C8N24_6408 [Solirubrobacter pauli]|uniref:Immunity MXAN-0049 protein domain-containing protein n=1 Tax=Solirubrobacter pauli TaxID=166793 RepID=A0A660L391_9ACTN|nr:hypothetical protein C8N24_6408 [Solirubrobacter pauli]
MAFREVQIALRGGRQVDDYAALAVLGRAGAIDRSLSEPVTIDAPIAAGTAMKGLRGLYFGLDQWDGSDVFSPEGAFTVIVTDRVRHAITAAKLTNVRFLSVLEFEQLAV